MARACPRGFILYDIRTATANNTRYHTTRTVDMLQVLLQHARKLHGFSLRSGLVIWSTVLLDCKLFLATLPVQPCCTYPQPSIIELYYYCRLLPHTRYLTEVYRMTPTVVCNTRTFIVVSCQRQE